MTLLEIRRRVGLFTFYVSMILYLYIFIFLVFNDWFSTLKPLDIILGTCVSFMLSVLCTFLTMIIVIETVMCFIEGKGDVDIKLTNVTVLQTSELCTICYEKLNTKVVSTKCSHCYHRLCIQKWANIQYSEHQKTLCPICNQNLQES